MLKKIVSDTGWIFFTVFAVTIGLYPISYFLIDIQQGLLNSKSDVLLNNVLWKTSFYMHIGFGGLALLSGFSQFFKQSNQKQLNFHRALGKIYVIAVLLSGISGLYISFFTTGGLIPAMGFGTLAVLWLFTTIKAYSAIKKRNINDHKNWMKRSFALCFAAVTLRIWLPVFLNGLNMDFIPAYTIIAWLDWVPNIIIVEWYIRKKS